MNQEQAIAIAVEEVRRRRANVLPTPPSAIFKERHMHLGKNRSGWLIMFALNVPDGFEPDHLFVEVYEPDGEVHILPIL